jgi:Domain of unknown function (DUF4148)
MTFFTRLAAGLLIVSTSTLAAQGLTPQQCNDYPFVRTTTPATHRQLVQELEELEAVGSNPSVDEGPTYPDGINQAQERLRRKYERDCVAHTTG